MKILFIENMYKTYTWEEISKHLMKDGHQIYFLVQNKIFSPKECNYYSIPYPSKKNLKKSTKDLQIVTNADRNINYFGGNNKHYNYYYKEIKKFIEKYKPDIVFGESTLFHELISIDVCKQNNILYLHPSEVGYPQNRVAFFKFDTKEPYTCKTKFKKYDLDAKNFIKNMQDRTLRPRYMKSNKTPFFTKLSDKVIRTLGRYGGEVYNTPSISKKISLERKTKKLLQLWDDKAKTIKEMTPERRVILFPMHMQPEANVDLWGQKYRNQTKFIEKIITYLPSDWKLAVKLNPKTKYELTSDLINVCFENKNIIPVKSDQSMVDIFEKSDVIITITGTILIECIFRNKPVISCTRSFFTNFTGVENINHLEEISLILKRFKDIDLADKNDKIYIYNSMMNKTYKGNVISGPFDKLSNQQTDNLVKAFKDILKFLNYEK